MIAALVAKAKKHRFFRSVVILSSASAGGQLILLAAMPFLTRLYSPDAFGVLAVFSALMGVVLVVSSLRYELAIPLPKNKNRASSLLFIALIINIVVASITLIIVALSRFDIAEFTDTPLLASYLWMLPIAILSGGTYKALNYWAIRNKDYRKIAITKLTQSATNVLAQVLGGVLGMGALGLIVGQIIGQSAGITRLSKGLSLKNIRASATKKNSITLLNRYKNFPKFDTPAAAINAVSAQLPNLAMALIFGPAVAGFYFLADRIFAVPMSIVGQAVGQVLFSQAREDVYAGNLFKRVKNLLLILFILVLFTCLIVNLFAEPFFAYVFGENWRESGVFSSWLVIGLSMQFLYSPLSMVLMATNGQLVNLCINTIILIMKALALFIAFLNNDSLLAVQLISLSLFLGYGLGVATILYRAYFHN